MSEGQRVRALAFGAIGVGILAFVIMCWKRAASPDSEHRSHASAVMPVARPTGAVAQSVVGTVAPSGGQADHHVARTVAPGSGPYLGMEDPRWKEYWKRREEDRSFEWKSPIAFYGKVVDEAERPVEAVLVSMSWTDMSPRGTSHTNLVSDAEGRFAISGIRGKNFGVDAIGKEGYYEVRGSNRYSFEYAGFWEPSYHEPDPDNPVLFHLRKKGEAEPLAVSAGKLLVGVGESAQVPWPAETSGKVHVEVTENDKASRKWAAEVLVEGGGILPALEEFPFLAPESGYLPSIGIDQDSPKPPGWQGEQGGRFYVKMDAGYAVLEIRQLITKKTMYYEVKFNPSGSRNLEFDPRKVVGPGRPAPAKAAGQR